jgi:hypothetical protein
LPTLTIYFVSCSTVADILFLLVSLSKVTAETFENKKIPEFRPPFGTPYDDGPLFPDGTGSNRPPYGLDRPPYGLDRPPPYGPESGPGTPWLPNDYGYKTKPGR